jgi:acyl-CoA synthetase (AMP-forming)/AMP-acid ligase II
MVAEAPAELLERLPGCAGFVHPWNKVQIVDEANRPLPFGAEGIVRIWSTSIVSGYLGDPPENRTAFQDGWFYPGDLGTVTKEGLLTITGRASEVINAGGVKVSPDLINNVLTGMHGIVEAAAFGVDYPDRPTEIWTAVVAPQPLDEAALIDSCRKTLGGRAPQRIVRVERIPRNPMGKVLTAELRRQVVGR